MLARLGAVLRGLELHPHRMRVNLGPGGGLIMAGAVMLDLGKVIGRQHAHGVEAAQAAVSEFCARWVRLLKEEREAREASEASVSPSSPLPSDK